MSSEETTTRYERAIKRIAAELKDQHATAVNNATETLCDGKHGKVTPVLRDYEQEARELFDAAHVEWVHGLVMEKLHATKSVQSWEPVPVPQPMAPVPPGPLRR